MPNTRIITTELRLFYSTAEFDRSDQPYVLKTRAARNFFFLGQNTNDYVHFINLLSRDKNLR